MFIWHFDLSVQLYLDISTSLCDIHMCYIYINKKLKDTQKQITIKKLKKDSR